MSVSVTLLAPPQSGGDTFKKVSYIISSKLKRYYPTKAVFNKTASCN